MQLRASGFALSTPLHVALSHASSLACAGTNNLGPRCALVMCEPPLDVEVELDDLTGLLEAMDIDVADSADEAATAWEASELDVAALKADFSAIGEREASAEVSAWEAAFGKAEVTDVVAEEAAPDEDDGFGEFVTY